MYKPQFKESIDKKILRDIDSIHNELKRLKGEVFQLKYGLTKEDEFFKKLIETNEKVTLSFLSGEQMDVIIKDSFRHCLVVEASHPIKSNLIIQKSSLKGIVF